MSIPTKKLKNGFEMPVFGIGTAAVGGEIDAQAIKNALNAGITHIDTAEIYSEGHAEEIVGEAIKNYDRGKLFIVSKVYSTHLKYEDLIKAAESSLKRLHSDYLDLYLIHAPNPNIPIEETMKAMSYLKDRGLIREIGVSNFTPETLEETQSNTNYKIVADQVHYNLIFREPEKTGLLEYCQANDVILIAWRPVEKGLLAQPDNLLMKEMCEKYSKTAAQIAINWLISQKNVVTIARMKDHRHLDENLGALNWQMEEKDITRLRLEFPNQQDISDLVPLG